MPSRFIKAASIAAMVFAAAMFAMPAAAHASTATMSYYQNYTSDARNEDRTVHYELTAYDDPDTPTDESLGHMPEGAVDGVLPFTLTGDDEVFFKVKIDKVGVYFYKAECVEEPRDNYTYDDTVLIAKLYVTNDDLAKEDGGTVLFAFEDGRKIYDPGWNVSYKAPVYKVTDMDGNPVIEFEDPLRFMGTGSYDKFVALYIDGKKLDPDDYEASKGPDGQTVITLKGDVAARMESGDHVVKMSWEDGEAEATISVPEPEKDLGDSNGNDNENGGGNGNVSSTPDAPPVGNAIGGIISQLGDGGWVYLAGGAALVAIVIIIVVRRKRKGRD